MTSLPRVSIVMPVRNGARFLPAALASLVHQTLADLEIIVIDDGSDDATGNILDRCRARDPRIRVLQATGRGIVPALQLGLSAAKADLVARMDADDIAVPDRLERQVTFLESRPEVVLVGSAITLIDGTGRALGRIDYPTDPREIRGELANRNCIAHPTVLMRKAAVLALGGYRAPFVMCEDYDLWLRLSERHDLANLDAALLHYRLHAGQSTWRAHEQRIWSEMGAQACARLRSSGRAEPGMTDRPIDPAFLSAAGVGARELASDVSERALAAAQDALARGQFGSARAALVVAMRQKGRPPAWRARAACRWSRRLVGTLMRRLVRSWRR